MRRLHAILPLLVLCTALHLSDSHMAHATPQPELIRVINDGIPGENSAEIRARLSAALATHHPDYVIIYAGMNDAVNERKFLSREETIRNLAAMVDEVRSHDATPILVIVQHVDEIRVLQRHDPKVYGIDGPNARIDQLDRDILHLADTHNIRVADFRSSLDQAGGANATLSTDGVHLTAQGYKLLATTIHSALPTQLSPHAVILCMGDSITYGTGVRPPDTNSSDNRTTSYPTYPVQLERMLHNNLAH